MAGSHRSFFDKQSAAWRLEQDGLQRKTQDVQKATLAPIDYAIDMLRLTSRASELFLSRPPPSSAGCSRWLSKRRLGRTARCERPCSNRSRSCAIRTRKVIEKDRRTAGLDAIWKFGSPAWIRTTIHGSKGRCPTVRRPGITAKLRGTFSVSSPPRACKVGLQRASSALHRTPASHNMGKQHTWR